MMMQYNNLRGRLGRLQLFPSPNDQQGPSWIKPVDYLDVTIIISGLGEEAVEQKSRSFVVVRIPTPLWVLSCQIRCLVSSN